MVMKFNFTGAHYELLAKELGIDKATLDEMTEKEFESLYEKVCEIEIAETFDADDEPLSQRGETAVEIVNIMAEALGYM
jgi:hypothetical protein